MKTSEKSVTTVNDGEWGYWVVEFTHVRPGSDDEEIMEAHVGASSEQEAIDRFAADGHPLFKMDGSMRTGYMIEEIYRMPESQRIALGYEL